MPTHYIIVFNQQIHITYISHNNTKYKIIQISASIGGFNLTLDSSPFSPVASSQERSSRSSLNTSLIVVCVVWVVWFGWVYTPPFWNGNGPRDSAWSERIRDRVGWLFFSEVLAPWRTFLWGWSSTMYILGANTHTSATVALILTHIQREVTSIWKR